VASAQVKSALLLAGLQAEGTTTVREPAPSRDHTERLLAAMGADLERRPDGAWQVRRSQLTLPERWRVPGDPSSAAFLLCAAAVLPGSRVTARGVLLNPTRTGFLTVLRRMGAAVEVAVEGEDPEPWGRVSVRQGPPLVACTVEAELFPSLVDEVPILALVATQAKGTTCFRGVGELRHKESDRLAMVVNQLRRMGARLAVEGEDLYVDGPTPLAAPRRLESAGDHRMAMMLRLAGLVAGAWPEVADEGCCAVSWPGFGRTLEALLA
jgi:3-phosphoshikimate 1-carboxyvinyltransferase